MVDSDRSTLLYYKALPYKDKAVNIIFVYITTDKNL